MKTIILFLLVGLVSFTSSLRARRNVVQFGNMIECLTDKDAYSDYSGYGCWCGYGGTGTPVDGTDRCCKAHDECYDDLKDSDTCSSWQLYTESYSYSCYNCDTQSASISCGSGNNDCEAGLCQCDKTAAECFRSATFYSAYRDYNKDNC